MIETKPAEAAKPAFLALVSPGFAGVPEVTKAGSNAAFVAKDFKPQQLELRPIACSEFSELYRGGFQPS